MKKIISAIIAAVMVFSICAVSAFADTKATFEVGKATAGRGETVTIDVSVKNVVADALDISVGFDTDVLTVTSGVIKQDNGMMKMLNDAAEANSRGLVVFNMVALANETYADGAVFTITFEVADDAAFGASDLSIAILCSKDGGTPLTAADYDAVAGSVTVACLSHDTTGVDWTETEPAKCEVPGTKVKYCKHCGAVAETGTIDPTDHVWGNWTEKTPAGCETPGEEERVCENDATHKETRPIDPTDHDWGDWTEKTPAGCETPGEEERVCENDPTHKETRPTDPTDHDWGDWNITTEPSLDNGGEATRVCSKDNTHTETMPLPAGVIVLTDANSGISIELVDPTEDSWFYGDSVFTAMSWDDAFDYMKDLGMSENDIADLKAQLDEFDAAVKEAAGSPVFEKYLGSVTNDNFDIGTGDADDASFVLTIPMNDDIKNAENLKVYVPDINAQEPAFIELDYELTDDGIVVDVTDSFIDLEGIPYIALAGDLPSPGTGVEFSVAVVALLAVSAAAAFVFARKRA